MAVPFAPINIREHRNILYLLKKQHENIKKICVCVCFYVSRSSAGVCVYIWMNGKENEPNQILIQY